MEFVAPGMVMSSAMFAAAYECTYGVYVRMIHQKTYEAILTTPLSLEDVVAGDILWGASKGTFNGTVMLLVVCLFGLAPSGWTAAVPPDHRPDGMALRQPVLDGGRTGPKL